MTDTPMKRRVPTGDERGLMEDLRLTLHKHPNMPAEHILAIAAQFVGNLVALQDQRRYTPAAVMEIVSTNIEEGNRAAIDHLVQASTGRVC